MNYPFNARNGHIVVITRIWGPLKSHNFFLALDTGSSDTVVNAELLAKIGYNLSLYPAVSMATAGGIIQAPEVAVSRLRALGDVRADFPVLAHTLPPTATVDGVLGLDFFARSRHQHRPASGPLDFRLKTYVAASTPSDAPLDFGASRIINSSPASSGKSP